MAASDNLRGDQFDIEGDMFDIEYDTKDTGASKYQHRITARLGNEYAGHMLWTSKEIRNIEVDPEYARQGLATAMWRHGNKLAADNARIPKPQHSAVRTSEGDAWAKSVGGALPRRKK
jgi:hypothetical protein